MATSMKRNVRIPSPTPCRHCARRGASVMGEDLVSATPGEPRVEDGVGALVACSSSRKFRRFSSRNSQITRSAQRRPKRSSSTMIGRVDARGCRVLARALWSCLCYDFHSTPPSLCYRNFQHEEGIWKCPHGIAPETPPFSAEIDAASPASCRPACRRLSFSRRWRAIRASSSASWRAGCSTRVRFRCASARSSSTAPRRAAARNMNGACMWRSLRKPPGFHQRRLPRSSTARQTISLVAAANTDFAPGRRAARGKHDRGCALGCSQDGILRRTTDRAGRADGLLSHDLVRHERARDSAGGDLP